MFEKWIMAVIFLPFPDGWSSAITNATFCAGWDNTGGPMYNMQHATTLLMAFRKKCCIWPWSSIVTPWYGVSDPTILQYIPIQLPTMREIKNLKMIYILFSIYSGTLWDINTSSEVCFYFCFFLTMNKDKILTHFFPMFLFYIPWKNPRKSKVFSEGIKWENLPDMG